MASFVSTGSPKLSRKSTPAVKVLDENKEDGRTPKDNLPASDPTINAPVPLESKTLANLQPNQFKYKITNELKKSNKSSGMEDILTRLRLNDSRTPTSTNPTSDDVENDHHVLDQLLSNLNDQHKILKQQEKDLKQENAVADLKDGDYSSTSDLYTPATDAFDVASSNSSHASETLKLDTPEILRVKQELEAAKSVITRQEQELAETRTFKHTMDQAMGPPSEVDFGASPEISDQTIGHLQSAFNASARPFTSHVDTWHLPNGSQSEQPDTFASTNIPRARGLWHGSHASHPNGFSSFDSNGVTPYNTYREPKVTAHALSNNYHGQVPTAGLNPGGNRTFSNSSTASYSLENRLATALPQYHTQAVARHNQGQMRSGSTFNDHISPFGSYASTLSGLSQSPGSPNGIQGQFSYQQRGLAPAVSPMIPEFPSNPIQGLPVDPWPIPVKGVNEQTYVSPLEPMNYRRLLDKTVSCDWKYIVDKIVCNNDQQASIFLQQKLKVGTAEQKYEIVESIVNQAYPLMINRFGNFLVQRCFEHGTPDQVIAIANAIQGNVLSLSMDPFGCHVIQKAFDSVPESHKADMVRELLRRIPDTVIHRYACHVWQKLFELRWSGEPPQIMVKVNEALRGMWHEVALGETGSLVVQNIFENCVEEEKRLAIEEVISNIDLIAHGQFGNWCIQHLCEHGSPPDKRRVIDHILTNAYSYSIDQFASKVVEKCLKISGIEFLDRYLSAITTTRPDRPRIPLIDIAGDQYGNYLVQWILMNTTHHQREQVAIHIRKHMVSLRGSKFGSRVAMLCCNPNSVTRPGPGTIVNPFGAPGQPRTGWPRFR